MVTPELEAEMQRERVIQLRAQHPDGDHPELRAIDEPAGPTTDGRVGVEEAQPVARAGKIGGRRPSDEE